MEAANPRHANRSFTMQARECVERAVAQAHVDPALLPNDRETLKGVWVKVASDSPVDPSEFRVRTREVLTRLGIDHLTATPLQWVRAALLVETTCTKCRGTGVYEWGACINGKMEHSGECYGCSGKGFQRHDDWVRNANYWRFCVKPC